MNENQQNKLAMYLATGRTMKQFKSSWAKVPAIDQAVKELESILKAIEVSSGKQDTPLSGITEDKRKLKAALAAAAHRVASGVFAYAQKIDNGELRQSVDYSLSDLITTKDQLMAARCTNILQAAQQHISQLKAYGITGALIQTLKQSIDAYSKKAPSARSAVSARTAITKNLKDIFRQGDLLLKGVLDKLMVLNFKESNPAFYNSYASSRTILDLGKMSLLVEYTVAPGSSMVVERVIIGSVLTNTGTTAIMVVGDTEENENGLQVIPGDSVTLHLTQPVITVINQHNSIVGKFKARVSSQVPMNGDNARKGKMIIVTVGPGESKRVMNIVPGSQVENLGPAQLTMCDCSEPDCGITDDDQPCGYEQTIDEMAFGSLDTTENYVNITNKDAVKSAKVRIMVYEKGKGATPKAK